MLISEIQALIAIGMDPAKLRHSAKNWQGFGVTAINGTVTSNIQIPGTAIVLMGLVIEGALAGDQMNIQLNNEIIYQTVSAGIASETSLALFPNGYLSIMRHLTGKDVLTLDYTATAGAAVRVNIVYLTNYTTGIRETSAAPKLNR